MAFKLLKQFLDFNWPKFFQGKTIKCIGNSEWIDYATKAHAGTKVEGVIIEDKTPYKTKEGQTVNNLYEKLTFKCKKDVQIPLNAVIEPVNPVVIAYGKGDYNKEDSLSITCDDIRIISQGKVQQ